MKYRYLTFSAVVALLMLCSNVVHAQKGGGGGGRGGGAPGGGARPAGASAGARPAGAASVHMNNGHYHNGNYHNGHYHNGYYYPGISFGIGLYPGLYGGYGYSYGYDYPYIAPRVAYYPQTIIVQGDSGPVSTAASVRVFVPNAQAKVFFDGNATKQEGTDRLFHTPSLTGAASYRVRAIWLENGKEMVQEAVASVRPGETTTVDFTKGSEELPIPK